MPRVRLLRAVILAVALAAAAPALNGATAQVNLTSPERQALEQDLARYQDLLAERQLQLVEIEKALGQTGGQLEQRIAERDEVSEQLAAKRREREQLIARIADLEAERTATEAQVAALDERLAAMAERIQDLLLSHYKQKGRDLTSSLATSKTFHELRVRNHYLGLLAEQDADVVNELDAVLEERRAAKAQLDAQLLELQAAEADLARAETDLAAARQRLDEVLAELNATRAGQLIQQQNLLEEQTRLEGNLGDVNRQLEQEIARLRAEEAAAREAAAQYAQDREKQLELQRQADAARSRADALTAPLAPLTTGFTRPFDGATLISRFGEGNNSYLGIQAPANNSAVRAVQAGRVSAVTYLGANFGYMVAVQHSGGLTSVYVNLRQPLVDLGDGVQQGTVLGYLGGGTLTPPDVLQFYAQRATGSNSPFIDPAPLLGW
ncbi:MAG: peptidoglycan DD-metalloendopeptidase family protein [Trueperaceae bacterium]|nr:peptidoglycan DD-metalloendopeptidase family protein [Trueperaceae bacterium]MCC6312302.1 peptidoglycan DD-metalloendopeptidase family protein [Trueperaceae bacterium]MCO5174920.1 peptidoglycan DD-metalloendopeptidase family protein [Trueperaceae bacterium]MCW5820613.1 peptidoglycan DD-metalloendopeptidase family protein [Trueperaceae bacterium]